MRLSAIAGLLLAVSSVIAQGAEEMDLSALMSQLGNPTEACLTEAQKYQACVAGKSSLIKQGTKEELQAFCNAFDQDKCKDFFNDINKSDSACLNTQEVNLADIVTDLDFIAAKLQYQVYCAKGKDGKLCPLTQYIVDNADKLENSNLTDLNADQLKIVANDCRDDSCQARMVSLKESSDNVKAVVAKLGDTASQMAGQTAGAFLSSNSTSAIFDKYYPFYKDKKCGSIDNSNDDGPKNSSDSSDASTLKKITYTFVTMMALSAAMLF